MLSPISASDYMGKDSKDNTAPPVLSWCNLEASCNCIQDLSLLLKLSHPSEEMWHVFMGALVQHRYENSA